MKENRLVVGSATWADTLPEWLLDEIKAERMIYGLGGLIRKDAPKVGNAEVITYLMTASLQAPLPHLLTEVYMYLATKVMEKQDKEVPDDIRKDELTQDEEQELKKLKGMIYSKRGGEVHHPC